MGPVLFGTRFSKERGGNDRRFDVPGLPLPGRGATSRRLSGEDLTGGLTAAPAVGKDHPTAYSDVGCAMIAVLASPPCVTGDS
jgi:hypothetical protein